MPSSSLGATYDPNLVPPLPDLEAGYQRLVRHLELNAAMGLLVPSAAEAPLSTSCVAVQVGDDEDDRRAVLGREPRPVGPSDAQAILGPGVAIDGDDGVARADVAVGVGDRAHGRETTRPRASGLMP